MHISSRSVLVVGLLALCPAIAVRAEDAKTAPANHASAKAAPAAMPAKASSGDVSWLKDADTAGNAEVAAATLAVGKAQRADVKAFAQKMVDEHAAANKELGAIATKMGVALPATKPAEHGLDTKSGADFDVAYLKLQVTAHEKAEKLFENAAKADDADIRTFAAKTLPAIREHLVEVRKLAGIPAPVPAPAVK